MVPVYRTINWDSVLNFTYFLHTFRTLQFADLVMPDGTVSSLPGAISLKKLIQLLEMGDFGIFRLYFLLVTDSASYHLQIHLDWILCSEASDCFNNLDWILCLDCFNNLDWILCLDCNKERKYNWSSISKYINDSNTNIHVLSW